MSFPYTIGDRNSSLFRLLYCLHFLLFCGFPNFKATAEAPSYFYFPPSISFTALFNAFPSESFFVAVQVLIVLSFLLMFIGYRTVLSSAVFGGLLVLLHNFQYSLGKIDHNFPHLVLPLFMAFTNWGNHWSVDSLKKQKTNYNSAYALSIFSMGLATAFFIAAVRKIRGSWLDIDSQALHYVLNKKNELFIDWIPNWFLEMGDWVVVGFELSFLLLYPKARWFAVCGLAALFFHTSVSLSLHIFFIGMPVVYCVYFLQTIPSSQFPIFTSQKKARFLPLIAIAIAALYLFQLVQFDSTFLDTPLLYPLFDGLFNSPTPVFVVSMQLALAGLGIFSLLKYRSGRTEQL